MKGILFALVLTNSLLMTVPGQGQVYLGGKAGSTLSSLMLQENRNDIYDPRINDESKMGATVGLIAKYFAQPHTGVQAELNFVQKGWTELLDTVNTFSTTLNYIELPVLTHLYLGKGRTRYFVTVGPSIGLLLSYSESDFNPDLEDEITHRITEENRKDFSVGIQGGAGISRDTHFGHLQAEFTYSLSFSNIFRDIGGDVPDRSLPTYLGITLAYMKKVRD